jgi:ABC-type Na+ efflux pump permease subunit
MAKFIWWISIIAFFGGNIAMARPSLRVLSIFVNITVFTGLVLIAKSTADEHRA